MSSLILPRAVRNQISAATRAASPRECCGLVEGTRVGGAIVVTQAHPLRNVADAPDAFEIDPAGHIQLLRALRGTERQIVGCYHSHPNGKPEPSVRDVEGGSQPGFVWLIAALTPPDVVAIRAYLPHEGGFVPVSIIETASLDPARRPRL